VHLKFLGLADGAVQELHFEKHTCVLKIGHVTKPDLQVKREFKCGYLQKF
jgi:hypothetical protein